MSDPDDIQNIHRRYEFTLINPASFYVSLIASIVIATILSLLAFFNYIQNYEIFYHMPAVVAALIITQYLVDYYGIWYCRSCDNVNGTDSILCCFGHVHIFQL